MERSEKLVYHLKSAVVWQPEREARLFAGAWRARGQGWFRVLVLTALEGLSPQLAESARRTAEERFSWTGAVLEERGELLLLVGEGESREFQRLLKLLEQTQPGPRYLLGVSGPVSPEEVRRGYEAACRALRENFRRPAAIAWAGEADGGSPESCVLRVMEYLQRHLDRIPSLDQIAREFHVNKFVFCRQFKGQTGQTFGDYIKRARLEEACRLLRETDLRVYQVADRVGFQNESSFSGFFKRETGLFPREYRQRVEDTLSRGQ